MQVKSSQVKSSQVKSVKIPKLDRMPGFEWRGAHMEPGASDEDDASIHPSRGWRFAVGVNPASAFTDLDRRYTTLDLRMRASYTTTLGGRLDRGVTVESPETVCRLE